LLAAESGIRRTLQEVQREFPNSKLDAVTGALEKDFAVLAAIERFTAHGLGRGGSAAAGNALAVQEIVALQSVLAVLNAAGASYAHEARMAQLEASIGSALAIVLLFVAFTFFQQRSVRSAARLRRALGELGLVQEDRMRLLARTVEGAEEERQRIAADLHDGPIQRLTALSFSLDLAASRLERGDPERVVGDLQQVRKHLAAEMASLRRLMAELRPPVLDEGGAAAAIRASVAEIAPTATEVSVRDRTGATRFPPELETVTYRVAREALANVERHAQASHVTVELERAGDMLRITIADDGVGFDPAAVEPNREHLGLQSIRERVESVGGELRIVSGAGLGTRLEASLPWRPRRIEALAPVARSAVA
ncbi:MAG: sensor histidine kinase, partial [Gaiellaceae bacterium]